MGFIGGKTQTDLAAMDDLYLDGESHNARSVEWRLTCCASAWYHRGGGEVWPERVKEEEGPEAGRGLYRMQSRHAGWLPC